MEKGYVNCALLLLTNNMSNGKLPLSTDTLQLLHLKHLEQQEAHNKPIITRSNQISAGHILWWYRHC